MDQQKIEETEQLITQLCSRFTHIFEQIKDIKEARIGLEGENQNLQEMIQEETIKFEKAADQMEKATKKLQEQNQQLENGELKSSNDKAQEIQNSLQEKKTILDVSHMKLKEVSVQLQSELSIKESLEQQMETVQANLAQIRQQIQEHQETSINVEQNIQQITIKNDELSEKTKNILMTLDKNEDEVKRSLEEKSQKEEEYKANLQDYRELLNQTSNYQKRTQETEKLVGKLSDELRSKLKRLEVLVKNKQKLENKLQKFDSIKVQYDQICQANQLLEDENYQIRSKLELYVEPESVNNNANRSFSSLRGFNSRQKNQSMVQKESVLYKKVKHNVLQSQYLDSLMKEMQEKDNQIFKNKKRITELNTQIEQQKGSIIDKNQQKHQLNEKLEIMKNSTQQLGEKYEKMCSEFGIQPYNIDQQQNQSQGFQSYNNTASKKIQFSQQSTPQRAPSGLKTLQ